MAPSAPGHGDTAKARSSLQESVNVDVIKYVKGVFHKADVDGGGDLDEAEFVAAFTGKLSTDDGDNEVYVQHVQLMRHKALLPAHKWTDEREELHMQEAMRKLFCRIDANADGALDWDEFSLYMLLENSGAAAIRESSTSMQFVHGGDKGGRVPPQDAHRKIMDCISQIPACGGAGPRYVTGARDGTVKLWDHQTLGLNRTIETGDSWITAVKYMPAFQCLAVTTFARSLTMYDITSPFCNICGNIPKMDFTPLTMDIWSPPAVKNTAYVVIGDAGGLVHLHALRPHSKHDHFQELSELDAQKGRPKAVDNYQEETLWTKLVHSKWVSKVQYIPALEQVVSCSLDHTLWMMDIERRTPFVKLEGHKKGVFCCDWSDMYKVVISCGADKNVLVFNPFSGKQQACLQGHMSTVTDCAVNDADNQIISLSSKHMQDKTIKVWDLRNFRCLQTIVDKEYYRQDDAIGGMIYDTRMRRLITGNVKLKPWPLLSVGAMGAARHAHPVTEVIYNRLFGDTVSGDQGGTVCVWNTSTGKLRFRFTKTHGEGHPITAMSFDTAHRRLFTGSDDGSVKAWNFSSGRCLKTMSSSCCKDVTGLVCTRGTLTKYVVAVGWDKRITFYDDVDMPKVISTRSAHGHRSDILAGALMESSPLLVTADSEGDLMVWNLESGSCVRTMVPTDDVALALPLNERGQEALAFMHGRLKHVIVSAGSSQVAYFWDVKTGMLLYEIFTGHYPQELVISVVMSTDNTVLVTGDSSGIIKTWAVSGFSSVGPSPSAAVASKEMWRGHEKGVASLEWVAQDESRLFLSAGYDMRVCVWRDDGCHVGTFGEHDWIVGDVSTWVSSSKYEMSSEDRNKLCVRSLGPEHSGALFAQGVRSHSRTSASGSDQDSSSDSSYVGIQRTVTQSMNGQAAAASISALLGRSSMIAARGEGALDSSDSEEEAEDMDVPVSLWMERFDKVSATRGHKGDQPGMRATTAFAPVAGGGFGGRPQSAPVKGGFGLTPQEKWRRRQEYKPVKLKSGGSCDLPGGGATGFGRFRA